MDSKHSGVLTLRAGEDSCELHAEIGGSIGSWIVRGQPMMRTASSRSIAAGDPYGMASFPLVPFSNRIGNANFPWLGRSVFLKANFPPEPHAIHGVGFERAWRVESRTPDTAVLIFRHAPDASWPWAFEARQRIIIDDRLLTLQLSARNLESHPQPLAFGHHPYFPMAGASLRFDASEVWLKDDAGLPRATIAPSGDFDFSRAVEVERRALDHCYSGWRRSAQISWSGQPWTLEVAASATLPAAVLYIRSGSDAFCFEPVPHLNNSLNLMGREPSIPAIAPGESFEASIRFEAHPRT
jgi:aldose 1-epimerase